MASSHFCKEVSFYLYSAPAFGMSTDELQEF